MSYIMYCLEQFNRLTIRNFLVMYCGSARIDFRVSIQDLVHGTQVNTLLHNMMIWGIDLTKFKVFL